MTENTISPESLLAINAKMKKTYEDDTPFPVVKDDQISVIGDANKTQVKKHNYSIKFRIPISKFSEKPENAEIVGAYYIFSVDFEDVTITPRTDLIIVDSIMKIQPFFNKLKENGEIEDYTNEEMLSVFAYAGKDVHLAIYNLVAAFLDISDDLGPYMLPFSVIGALSQLIDNHPEVFNEAESFFG